MKKTSRASQTSPHPRLCGAPECIRAHYAHGWCKLHGRRVAAHGSFELPPKPTDMERFMSRVEKSGECWLWAGAISDTGYASFRAGGRGCSGHRFIYEEIHGKQPSDMHLDHLCRVRRCVNPDHLELVTPAENNRRGLASSTGFCWRGHDLSKTGYTRPDGDGRFCQKCSTDRYRENRHRKHPVDLRMKLTSEQALAVVELANAGVNQRAIAARFGVAQSTVGRLVRGKSRIEGRRTSVGK